MRQRDSQRHNAGTSEVHISTQERRWRHALYYQAFLVVGMAAYWVIYMILILTLLSGSTAAPLVADGTLLVVHAVVLRLAYRRPSEAERSRLSAVALVAGGPCFALVHPKIQPIWLGPLGQMPGGCLNDGHNMRVCQQVGSYDYRTDGPLIFQWFTVYHILLQLKVKHALFASVASTVLYFGLLTLGGASVDYIDLLVAILPVVLALATKANFEAQNEQLDALVEKELALRSPRPQVLPDASSEAFMDEEAPTAEPSLAPYAETGVGTAAASLMDGIGSQGDSGNNTTSFNISNTSVDSQSLSRLLASDANAPSAPLSRAGSKVLCATTETGCQTSERGKSLRGASMRDGASQTWIVWQKDGFHCTRCSKPPLLPRRSAASRHLQQRQSRLGESDMGSESEMEENEGRSSASGLRNGGDGRSSASGSQSGGDKVELRFPTLQKTPRRSEQILLLSCALAWNVRMRPGICCVLHATTRELQQITMRLQKLPCESEPYSTVYQCLNCGACADVPADTCSWCSSDHVDKTPHTTAVPQTSVSL